MRFVSRSVGLLRKCLFFKQDLSDIANHKGQPITTEDYEQFKNLMNETYRKLDSYRRKVERIKEINDSSSYLLDQAHHGAKFGYYYGVNMNLPFEDYPHRSHPALKPYFRILANKERMLADVIRNKIRELESSGKLPIGSKIVTSDPPDNVIENVEWEHAYKTKKKEKNKESYGIRHKFTRGYLKHLKQTRSGYDKGYYPDH